jgi:hypothetical protein
MGESVKRCVGRQLRLMALTVVFALPASSVELVGTTRATFEWTPSADDVFGYEVYVERNGGPRLNVELVVMPRATVEAQYGDEIIVSVRAVGFLGEKPVYSPFSTRSVSVKFLEPPRFGGDGTLALHCDQCSKVEFHSIADGDVLGDLTVPAGVWQIVDAADVDLDNEADLVGVRLHRRRVLERRHPDRPRGGRDGRFRWRRGGRIRAAASRFRRRRVLGDRG